MSFWTEIHWSEGMFLRPHHLQVAQRWMETVVDAGLDSARSFAWGFLKLEVAQEPLENSTLRLDSCSARMKDGTWVQIPENTQVDPLNFQKALESNSGAVTVYFGIPEMQEVRSNSVSLENPEATNGTPRARALPASACHSRRSPNPSTCSPIAVIRSSSSRKEAIAAWLVCAMFPQVTIRAIGKPRRCIVRLIAMFEDCVRIATPRSTGRIPC